ncbi:MAG: hypothetical protein JNK35_11520 [Phycisphaerae bacterium]|nr:hypothetical protein [Phycisphaerae bacterium]
MNLVSDRRANTALIVLIVSGLTAGMSAITYARYTDMRTEQIGREGVTLSAVLAMKARAAASHPNRRCCPTPAPIDHDAADLADCAPADEAALFEPDHAESLPEPAPRDSGTLILKI